MTCTASTVLGVLPVLGEHGPVRVVRTEAQVGGIRRPRRGGGETRSVSKPVGSDPWRLALGQFGVLLRALRQDALLTQRALARHLGSSGSSLSDLERGVGERVPSEGLVYQYIDHCLAAWQVDQVLRDARRVDLIREFELLVKIRERTRGAAGACGAAVDTRDQTVGQVRDAHPADDRLESVLLALTVAVRLQWRNDQERRSIQDPGPLLLRWMAQDGRSGRFDELATFFAQLPIRRLVILGQPGAGKTASAGQLVVDLLDIRSTPAAVPVLFSVSGWDPAQQRLPDWMTDRLVRDHPQLSKRVKFGTGRRCTLAEVLIESGRILPVLDGLDQLPELVRGEAIDSINRLGSDLPVVVTCRTEVYREAIMTAERGLSRSVVVELQPLNQSDVCRYLNDETGKRWEVVTTCLIGHPEGPLAQVLRTPLMVWLVRSIYRKPNSNLDELCRFTDAAALESHLFDHLVPAVYPTHPTPEGLGAPAGRWTAAEARQGLTFLARHLISEKRADLAWWQLGRAVPRLDTLCGVLAGAAVAIGTGVTIESSIAVMALMMGFFGALAVNRRFLAFMGVHEPGLPHTFRFTAKVLCGELLTIFADLLLFIVMAVSIQFSLMVLAYNTFSSFRAIAIFVLAVLVAVVVTGWFFVRWVRRLRAPLSGTVTVVDLERAVCPRSTLRSDRTVTLLFPAVVLVPLLSAIPFVEWLRGGMPIAVGVCVGWVIASAWFRFSAARVVLALRGKLPWRTVRFFESACDRDVLRQVGAVYEFHHPLLRDRLASGASAQHGRRDR